MRRFCIFPALCLLSAPLLAETSHIRITDFPASSTPSIADYISKAAERNVPNGVLKLLKMALPSLAGDDVVLKSVEFPESGDRDVILARCRYSAAGKDAEIYLVGNRNGFPICRIPWQAGLDIKSFKRMGGDVLIVCRSTDGRSSFTRQFPLFGIPLDVVKDTGSHLLNMQRDEMRQIPLLQVEEDSVTFSSLSPSGARKLCQKWIFAGGSGVPSKSMVVIAPVAEKVVLEADGVISCRWAACEGRDVLACHTQDRQRASMQFFLVDAEKGVRRLHVAGGDDPWQSVTYSENGIFEGRLEYHLSAGPEGGPMTESDHLVPLFAEAPMLGADYCTALADAELVDKARKLGVSDAHLRVLAGVVLDPAENGLNLSSGQHLRWIGGVKFPEIDSRDFIVASVSPRLAGRRDCYWTIVADKSGSPVCRINHMGPLDIRKVYREDDLLCLEYQDYGTRRMKLNAFGIKQNKLLHFDAEASREVISGASEEFFCFDEDEGPVLTSRSTEKISPSGEYAVVEESLFEKESGNPVGYVLTLRDAQSGDEITKLGRGHRKCTYLWIAHKGWEILLIKQHESHYLFKLHAIAVKDHEVLRLAMPDTDIEYPNLEYTLRVTEDGVLKLHTTGSGQGDGRVILLPLDELLQQAAAEAEEEEEDE